MKDAINVILSPKVGGANLFRIETCISLGKPYCGAGFQPAALVFLRKNEGSALLFGKSRTFVPQDDS